MEVCFGWASPLVKQPGFTARRRPWLYVNVSLLGFYVTFVTGEGAL
jgi:hypothetical protein